MKKKSLLRMKWIQMLGKHGKCSSEMSLIDMNNEFSLQGSESMLWNHVIKRNQGLYDHILMKEKKLYD